MASEIEKKPTSGMTACRGYNYDSPDGQDCFKKTLHSTKLGAMIGAYMSLYDIVGITKPKGAIPVMARMLVISGPPALAGGTFAFTSCVLGDLRGKDGALNHAIGGLLGGAVLGSKMAGPGPACAIAFGAAAAAAMIKYVKDAGVVILEKEGVLKEGPMMPGFYGPRNRVPEPTNY